MKQFTLMVGLNDKDTHKRVINKTKAIINKITKKLEE